MKSFRLRERKHVFSPLVMAPVLELLWGAAKSSTPPRCTTHHVILYRPHHALRACVHLPKLFPLFQATWRLHSKLKVFVPKFKHFPRQMAWKFAELFWIDSMLHTLFIHWSFFALDWKFSREISATKSYNILLWYITGKNRAFTFQRLNLCQSNALFHSIRVIQHCMTAFNICAPQTSQVVKLLT